MSEEQEIEKTETTEDVEGHHHHGMGKRETFGVNAEDKELATDEDDVEGHHHHGMGKR
ncbi:MAG TPA: hypothetical protein VIO57_03170 [Chloroflexota bacterium]|jgi:hypothetical protein